jgi:uncharacterized membrane protein
MHAERDDFRRRKSPYADPKSRPRSGQFSKKPSLGHFPGAAAEDEQQLRFAPIDVSGAKATTASGINTRGDVVGSYTDTGTPPRLHGFLLRDGHISTIDYPGAMFTALRGINSKGDIVGTAQFTPSLPGGDVHGFVLRDGEFTSVQFPGHLNTVAVAITDRGEVVGCYHDKDTMGTMHGFIFADGQYTALDGVDPPLPDKPASMNNGVTRNGDLIVGLWTDMMAMRTRGFFRTPDDGAFVPFDVPGSVSTAAWSVNRSGEVVGVYADMSTPPKNHGFLMRHGDFVSIDYPAQGVRGTAAFGINRQGHVVGQFADSAGVVHGFLLVRGVDQDRHHEERDDARHDE